MTISLLIFLAIPIQTENNFKDIKKAVENFQDYFSILIVKQQQQKKSN